MAAARSKARFGCFLWTDDECAIGKWRTAADGECIVEHFVSTAERHQSKFPPSAVKRAYLSLQTRVYWLDENKNTWRMGRITASDIKPEDVVYEVAFPNEDRQWISERDLETRCLGPHRADPTEVLACWAMETQFLHDRRLAVQRALVGSRATSRGLTGLLSASVSLVPHQVEVVRRVLEDPVQRYLLADEVGLGKTIEAGIIIRQCLLDRDDASVVVLAPPALVRQWEQELRAKFDIIADRQRVQVLSFDDLPGAQPCDLLVVDEAHHLVGGAIAPERSVKRRAYERLATLATASSRVLLLSATPLLGNESAMLAMLHLLDPLSYRLEEQEAFRAKVERRQEIGRQLLALNEKAPPFLLRQMGTALGQSFPDDEVVAALVPRLTSGASEDTTRTVRAIKRHVADTYRLHQRLLRTRRRDLEGWELQPRQGRVLLEPDEDERVPDVIDALEAWRYRSRQSLLEAAGSENGGKTESALAYRYAGLVEALGRGVDELAREIKRQWKAVAAGQLDTFEQEAARVAALERALALNTAGAPRLELAETVLALAAQGTKPTQGGPTKIVAFTSDAAFARRLHERLSQATRRSYEVFGVQAGMTLDEINDATDEFRDCARPAVIVCDRSGEEGLNFHFAHSIVHLDVPLSPSRLEQRIGRVDRFGREEPLIRHRLLVPSDEEDTPWAAWCELLRGGFGLFDASISEVQFLLETLQEECVLEMFRSSAEGLRAMIPRVKQRLQEERARLDEQYALDRLEMGESEASSLFSELVQQEKATDRYGAALDAWTGEVLQLEREQARRVEGAFELHWTSHTLAPKEPWYDVLYEGLERPLTYNRDLAVRREARLVRSGFSLVDGLQRFMAWDDRGTAFATWRVAASWPTKERGEWLGFRLCYAVEADVLAVAEQVPGANRDAQLLANLQRRADAYLAPWLAVLHADTELREVTEPSLLELLHRPYRDRTRSADGYDYNLGSRQEALFALIAPEQFAALCRAVRARSEEWLRARPRFREALATVLRKAREDLELRNERLERRRQALERETGRADAAIAQEIAVNTALAAALEAPRVRLDAIGFFVVADYPPSGVRGC